MDLKTRNIYDFPQVGDVQVFSTDTMVAGLTVGSGGADQVWDFSGLVPQTNTFQSAVDVSTTPNASDFPTADYAISSFGFFSYVGQSSDKVEVLGFALDIDGGGTFTSFVFI